MRIPIGDSQLWSMLVERAFIALYYKVPGQPSLDQYRPLFAHVEHSGVNFRSTCICPRHPGNTGLDLENVVLDPEELAALCGSLFTVDKGSGVRLVRLAHVAIQGYICSDRLAVSYLGLFHINPTEGILEIGFTCIR